MVLRCSPPLVAVHRESLAPPKQVPQSPPTRYCSTLPLHVPVEEASPPEAPPTHFFLRFSGRRYGLRPLGPGLKRAHPPPDSLSQRHTPALFLYHHFIACPPSLLTCAPISIGAPCGLSRRPLLFNPSLYGLERSFPASFPSPSQLLESCPALFPIAKSFSPVPLLEPGFFYDRLTGGLVIVRDA